MQENLPCEPHAVRCRVSCIMAAHNHNARNSISLLSTHLLTESRHPRSPETAKATAFLPSPLISWCRDPELNWGHPDFQSGALPAELSRHPVALSGGPDGT